MAPPDHRDQAPPSPLAAVVRPHFATTTILSLLRLVAWLSVPSAVGAASRPFAAIGLLAAGLAAALLERIVVQRVRPSMRRHFLEQAAQRAIRHSFANDAERLGQLFLGAYEAESVIVSSIPSVVGACVALMAAGAMTARRFSLRECLPWVLAMALVLVVRQLTRDWATRAVDEETRRGDETTALLDLCLRSTGELGRGRSGDHLVAIVGRAADEWARAESRRETIYRTRRFALIGILVAGGLALTLLVGGSPASWSVRALASVDGAWPLILLPLVYSLGRSVDGLSRAVRSIAIAGIANVEAPPARLRRALPSNARLRSRRVTVRYGAAIGLDDIEFESELFGLTVVVGPNAAGKSTLARAIGGIIAPSDGELTIGEVPCGDLEPDQIAYLPQHPAWLPSRSILENVRLGAPDAKAEDVANVLVRLGVEIDSDRAIGSLSGGQQRRVAVARALLRSPKLLILDEADAGLDRGGREWLADVVREEATRCAVVVVTHHPTLFAFADRVIVLDGRHRLVDFGTPASVRRRCAAFDALMSSDELFGSSAIDEDRIRTASA